jgi:hypothetical protein
MMLVFLTTNSDYFEVIQTFLGISFLDVVLINFFYDVSSSVRSEVTDFDPMQLRHGSMQFFNFFTESCRRFAVWN